MSRVSGARTERRTPVALSPDLPAGGVIRTMVDGQDLAVWRSRSGQVRAWDNRCPHRGMRFSFGFVRGESLTCIYHGWQYGIDGICHTIPAHPDLTPPSTLSVIALTAVEQGGLIWVSPDKADHQDMPYIEDEAEPLRSLTINQSAGAVASLLQKARFPSTKDGEVYEGIFASSSPPNSLVIGKSDSDDAKAKLIAALQPLPDNRTTLHTLTTPDATPALKITISRWLEQFRRQAEDH